jgi:hypothetical protein
LIVVDRFFMEESDVCNYLKSIKSKMFEWYDHIPLKIIHDARELLISTLTMLFKKIYHQNVIPNHWKISKIMLIPKRELETRSKMIAR